MTERRVDRTQSDFASTAAGVPDKSGIGFGAVSIVHLYKGEIVREKSPLVNSKPVCRITYYAIKK